MLALALVSIVLGIVDIETQYDKTAEVTVNELKCSIQTQKNARDVSSLNESSYWLLQSIRLMVSITSIMNIVLLLTYHKLEKNLMDLKQKHPPRQLEGARRVVIYRTQYEVAPLLIVFFTRCI